MNRINNQQGQLLIEVLIAIVVGAVFLVGATAALLSVIRTNFENRGNQVAGTLAYEQLNKVVALADSNWHSIYNLNKGSGNKYFSVSSATTSIAVSGMEGSLFNDITAGLVGHWKFDEASGDTIYDSSGYFLNGTLVSSPTRTASSSCQISTCLTFNGSNYIQGVHDTALHASAMTFAAWVNTSDGEGTILSKTETTSPWYGYVFGIGSGTVTDGNLGFWDGGGSWIDSGVSVNDGVWHHVAATVSSNILSFYKDGVLSATTSVATLQSSTQPFRIGRENATDRYLAGLIDDVRVYNRALSAQEISTIAKSAPYERYFYVDNVERDSSGIGNIVESGGTSDPSTQKVTSVVTWEGGRSVTFTSYITRNGNTLFFQNNWSDGGGVDGPITIASSTFATSSNITFSQSLTLATTTASGELESSIFDTQEDGGVAINSILWQGAQPSGTLVRFRLAYANSDSGPWNYVGNDGTGTSYFAPTGPDTSLPIGDIHNYRYLRYKAYLDPDSGNSPEIDGIYINISE